MLDALPKAAFSVLASSHTLKRLASLRDASPTAARRFIAGETVAEAIERGDRAPGLMVTPDQPGESVSSADEAARRAYVDMIGRSSGQRWPHT
jgi:hypothetical protein